MAVTNVCWMNKRRNEWVGKLFAVKCNILLEIELTNTDTGVLLCMWQMEHAGTIHDSCHIAADLPLFLKLWKPFLPISPSYEAAAGMWFPPTTTLFFILSIFWILHLCQALCWCFCIYSVLIIYIIFFFCYGNKNTELPYTLLHRNKLKVPRFWPPWIVPCLHSFISVIPVLPHLPLLPETQIGVGPWHTTFKAHWSWSHVILCFQFSVLFNPLVKARTFPM